MHRFAAVFLLITLAACSPASDPPAEVGEDEDVKDGTLVNNEHRQIVYDYYDKLKKTADAESERKVVTAFAAWLNEHGYKLDVVTDKDGSTTLMCPHMPTSTPWTEYTFHDAGHLELLPKHESDR